MAEDDGHGEDYEMSLVARCGLGSLEPFIDDKISSTLLAQTGIFVKPQESRRPGTVVVSEIYFQTCVTTTI